MTKKMTDSFDPTWRDDFYVEQALDIPLILPNQTEPNSNIWVQKQVVRGEEIFGEYHTHKKPRIITAILKRSPLPGQYTLTDMDGKELEKENAVFDLIFPPKAWMTDSAQELSTMYNAAKDARGDVLVGGLGLAIYPQMAFALQRPIDSITIVENNPDVIEIVTNSVLNKLDRETREKITVLESTFEEHAASTSNTYNTILLDLWEDSDPRFLPHMNYIVNLSGPLCRPGGKIRCWSYAITVDAFVKIVDIFEKEDVDIEKIPQFLDPLLKRYARWRNKQNNDDLALEKCEKKARQLALTVTAASDEYDRDKCFSPFPMTRVERHAKQAILAMARRKQEELPET